MVMADSRHEVYRGASSGLVVVDGLTAYTVFRGERGSRFALGQAFA